jgi:hypothetical protein
MHLCMKLEPALFNAQSPASTAGWPVQCGLDFPSRLMSPKRSGQVSPEKKTATKRSVLVLLGTCAAKHPMRTSSVGSRLPVSWIVAARSCYLDILGCNTAGDISTLHASESWWGLGRSASNYPCIPLEIGSLPSPPGKIQKFQRISSSARDRLGPAWTCFTYILTTPSNVYRTIPPICL